MSKPKHYMRNRGCWVGYGYRSIELHAKKCARNYRANLSEEIVSLKSDGKHAAKLRKYLKRVL